MIPADLEETQEIARTSFPPMSGDDPLEETQPIYLPEDAFTGVRIR